MSISPYFDRSEFACSCGCGFDTVDAELIEVLTVLRKHFDAPVNINSSARCETHNSHIGGSPRSQHKRGRAADIVVKGATPGDVYTYLDTLYPSQFGIGKYNSFTHIDTRGIKARWRV